MLPRLRVLEEAISPQHNAVFTTLIEANEKLGINATLRVAGGWVRDTLLGLHSSDIDIAIETPSNFSPISGEHFARSLARYQADQAQSAERTVSVIRVNPALSKHIETATVCVHNIPVEFCALRTDTYTETSRIPCTSPGTPLEDARRRDFTVNALFYNLHSKVVEDYTTGLIDLENRTLRTPLEPKETFQDDPLRLLRGIRFAGQLGNLDFRLDDAIFRVVDDSVLELLLEKVSRDRIGKEFLKMVNSPKPEKCLELLLQMEILQKVVLAEVHIPPSLKKKGPANLAMAPIVYPLRRVVDTENGTPTHHREYLEMIIHHVVPLLGEEGGILFFPGISRMAPILFTLIIFFYRGATTEFVEKSLIALCLNGLKLSKMECQGVRRMVESFNILWTSGLSLEEFSPAASGGLSRETKDKLLRALFPLHDPSVIPEAFKLVLSMYAVLGWNRASQEAFLGGEDFSSLPLGHLSQVRQTAKSIWEPLSSLYSPLLVAFQRRLPLDGNDLRLMMCIPPKEIGTALMELRREIALNPGTLESPESAAAWVSEWYGRKNTSGIVIA